MKDHISREQFLIEFFGNLGRELGDPNQHFTDNPLDVFPFIEECTKEKKPAFISVQPRTSHHNPKKGQFGIYGIEKIFYDFDYGRKSDKFTPKQIKNHKTKLEKEVRIFVNHLMKVGITPLIVKTRKGYHFYIYFDRIYQISNDEDFWKEVYKILHKQFVNGSRHKYKYVDTSSRMDISRLCRIPTSIHQKSGEECIVLDTNFKPTKLRSIEYYKMYGLKRSDLIRAVELARVNIARKKEELKKMEAERKDNWEMKHGFVGRIRPCFQNRMDAGEMCHQQRLALLIEAFFYGIKTREEMIEFFRWSNDWDGDQSKSTCRDQVNWFFDNKVDEAKKTCNSKPYRCLTIQEKGWCLEDECPIYRRRKEYAKTKGKTQ